MTQRQATKSQHFISKVLVFSMLILANFNAEAQDITGFEKIVKRMESCDNVKIVCYGNSVTYGYKVGGGRGAKVAHPYPETLHYNLRKKFSNEFISVVNEGHSGWRSDQALKALNNLVISKKPDLVTIMFGINDAYNSFTLPYYKKKMKTMVQTLKSKGIEVWLVSPTPVLTSYDETIKKYIIALEEIAKEENVAFTNVHDFFSNKIKLEKEPKDIIGDGVHPVDGAYPWIANIMMKDIIAILAKK